MNMVVYHILNLTRRAVLLTLMENLKMKRRKNREMMLAFNSSEIIRTRMIDASINN